MLEIGVARLIHRVVVNVDHVIKHTHRGDDGTAQLVMIDLSGLFMPLSILVFLGIQVRS